MLSMEVSALLLLLEVLGYFTLFSVDPTIFLWILLSFDHAKETGTRGLTTKCGVVMKGGIVLVIIQLSTSMALNYLLQTGSVHLPFRHSSEIRSLCFMKCSSKIEKKNFHTFSFCDISFFFHSLNMAKFKAFQWIISSSRNL